MRFVEAIVLMAIMTPTLTADEIDLWIGFTGVQTQSISSTTGEGRRQGLTKYVDVLVGSNESKDEAKVHQVGVYLSVTSAEGRCSTSSAISAKVMPPANVVRFQVSYPAGSVSSSRVEYMLRASLSNPSDATGSAVNDRKEFAFTLPAGGGPPVCVKLK